MSRHISRALVLVGVSTGLLLTVNLAIGAVFIYVLKIPGGSGFLTGFTVPFVLCLVGSLTRRFGYVTLTWLLYSTVAIPLALMGPPTIYKPLIGLTGGLVYDIVLFLLRRSGIAYYVAMVAYTLALMAAFYGAYTILDLPGAETFYRLVKIITAVFIAEGVAATWTGRWLYTSRFAGTATETFFRPQPPTDVQ